jgi:hypothetical protein
MAQASASGPTVLRMILGRQLLAAREKAGLTADQAAEVAYACVKAGLADELLS